MSEGRGAIRVPLAVDAQFRLPVGPALLPVRALALVALVSPAAYALLALGLPGLWGAAAEHIPGDAAEVDRRPDGVDGDEAVLVVLGAVGHKAEAAQRQRDRAGSDECAADGDGQ